MSPPHPSTCRTLSVIREEVAQGLSGIRVEEDSRKRKFEPSFDPEILKKLRHETLGELLVKEYPDIDVPDDVEIESISRQYWLASDKSDIK